MQAFKDKDGNRFDGGKKYRLRVPANAPAEQFWSLTLYDTETRAMIQNRANDSARSGLDTLETTRTVPLILTLTSGNVQPNAAVSVKLAQQYDTLVAFRDSEMSLRRQQCRRALSGNNVVTQWMWAVGHASRVDVAAAADAVPRLLAEEEGAVFV